MYGAGQPEKIFQNWLESNIWSLGADYSRKYPARKIGIFSESDLIMETTDGYIDLIELKRPCSEILSFDKSHNSYYPSSDLSKVLGQCFNYLKILDEYKLVLEKQYKFRLIRPRIKIITGRTHEFSENEHDALRMINSNLNHVQVISYDYLYECGKALTEHYSKD